MGNKRSAKLGQGGLAPLRAWAAPTALLLFLLAALFVSPCPARAGDANVGLLLLDSDIYAAQQAVSKISLPGIQMRAFCMADLQDEESLKFLRDCSVLFVNVMGDELSGFVTDNELLQGKTVFALSGSKDDQGLTEKGFVFNEEIQSYSSDPENTKNMILRGVNLTLDDSVTFEPPRARQLSGIYHPEAEDLFSSFDDYRAWYEKRASFSPERPWLGLMFFPSFLEEGHREVIDELVARLEKAGFNMLSGAGTDIDVIDNYFLDVKRASRVDAVLSFSLKFYSSLNEKLKKSVEDIGVPIFNAFTLYSITTEQWKADPRGIPPLDVMWTQATPEISGTIEPIPLIGKIEERFQGSGGRVYRYELVDGMTEHIASRIHKWIKLVKMRNADKRVAIMYYNHSAGKQNIGASYLNVFRSLEEIVASMKKAGYAISDDVKLLEEDIKEHALRGGRNIGSWAPGELDAMLATGQAHLLPVSEYKKWFAELPEDFRKKVTDQWGQPEDGNLMIKDGNIIIPLIRAGNIIMLPEPARGATDDPAKLYHDPHLYPHHQYIAAYLWLKHGFKADAMVHLGTHATYEWLPGKQAGLSLSCPPEVLMTDIPNVYPYIVDDIGEGIQAKRRGRGVIVDHMTPLLVVAEGYSEYAELQKLCEDYTRARTVGSATADSYFAQIRDLVLELGLDKDLEIKEIKDETDIQKIAVYLEYLEKGVVPHGLHTFGRSPSKEEALTDTTDAIVSQNPEFPRAEVAKRVAQSGSDEMKNFLGALEGRYVPPAEGNDPVRNPDSLPTGRNFYGLSPNRMPTATAWDLGQKAADQIIKDYIAENDGEYPEKVAVIVWAVESLRNEGLNESTILALIGVEPVWNPSGVVTGTRPIPGKRLGRPRVDVAINASGLYRDLFPDKILFLDAAIRQAAAQDDIENFISRNDAKIKNKLIESGMSEEEAGRFSRARIFSEAPGAYGNRVSSITAASGLWEDDQVIADAYLDHTGFAYGGDMWGAPSRETLEENLKDARVSVHSRSSNVFGLMDNDDTFMYLGGQSMAIRKLSGEAPRTLISDQRTKGAVGTTSLAGFLGEEMRQRYLNPKWVEGMKAENYAGAREMSNYVEYLWGWQVTTPEAVDETSWEQTFEVYVEDKYDLGIQEFMDANNAWAYQSLTGRMLETTRKGYWDADEATKQKLAVEYATSVVNRGLACCDHTCNNPQFHQMVANIISIPGLMSPEMVAEFKLAVETAGQQTLEEMVAERENLLQNLGTSQAQAAENAPPSESEAESVSGFKMEEVQESEEKTSVSSSGVEWFAAFFVLFVLAVFFAGFRRRGQKNK